jgi:hypothetical protein
MSDEPKECNILKLISIMRFACAALDLGQPIYEAKKSGRDSNPEMSKKENDNIHLAVVKTLLEHCALTLFPS